MDTNLYEFLIHLRSQIPCTVAHSYSVDISRTQVEWLRTFLNEAGTVVEFRSRPTGRMIPLAANQALVSGGVMLADREEPEVEKHFAIAGNPQEVFAILYEAMMLNPLLAEVMISACRAYKESSPICRACSQRHPGQPITDCPDLENPSWEFKERIK